MYAHIGPKAAPSLALLLLFSLGLAAVPEPGWPSTLAAKQEDAAQEPEAKKAPAAKESRQEKPAKPSSSKSSSKSGGNSKTMARLVRIPLPITGDTDLTVRARIEQALATLERKDARPVLVLEFRGEQGSTGEASQFERCLSLARYIASERLSQVRTVAYLPQTVRGHSVLVAMASEEIVMNADAELGDAGVTEDRIDDTIKQAYREIARRRLTLPEAMVLGMLDRSLAVFRIETPDGVKYVFRDEKDRLQDAIIREDTVVLEGDLARISGRELRLKHRSVSHLASNYQELAEALKIPADVLTERTVSGEGWTALQVEVVGRMNSRLVNDAIRGIDDSLRSSSTNLILLRVDSPGGSPADSMRLANYLASLDRSAVRTVAFVEHRALGDAVLPVLCADDLIVTAGARLGGPGEKHLGERELKDLKTPLKKVAESKKRDWSLMFALVNPDFPVARYTHRATGQIRYFSEEEASQQLDPGQWEKGNLLDVSGGARGAEAVDLRLATKQVGGFDELLANYGIQRGQLKEVASDWAINKIEQLAAQPWLARTLLFVAFFALISEASAPGLGVPGFISALCFLLFFWAQFLNGTAGWLEVLLFAGGLLFITLEIVAIPGFGVFGIGGATMVIAAIILASQTFVIPQNSYQLRQLPGSLLTVAVAMGSSFVALVMMRHYLAESPLFQHLMLAPPSEEAISETAKPGGSPYDFLLGQDGRTTTQLTPSGKARFGEEVVSVVSEGELIPLGIEVRVVEVHGNRIVVAPVEELA